MTLDIMMQVNPFPKDSGEPLSQRSQSYIRPEVGLDPAVESMYDMHARLEFQKSEKRDHEMVLHLFVEPLSPPQIDIVLQKIIATDSVKDYLTGLFMTRLIQKSYREGHNDFILTTNDIKIPRLCYRLRADPSNIIKVSIEGIVGDESCENSEYCSFVVKGGCGFHMGVDSSNCTYEIHGDTDFQLGDFSKDCRYHIFGDVGDDCGGHCHRGHYIVEGDAELDIGSDATASIFEIKGRVGRTAGSFATHCTFKTPNTDTYKHLLETVEKNEKNRVILTTKNGKTRKEVTL